MPAAARPATDNVPRRSSPAEQNIFAPAKLDTVSKLRLFESPRAVKNLAAKDLHKNWIDACGVIKKALLPQSFVSLVLTSAKRRQKRI
jgi:hypothetical protein